VVNQRYSPPLCLPVLLPRASPPFFVVIAEKLCHQKKLIKLNDLITGRFEDLLAEKVAYEEQLTGSKQNSTSCLS
jgi:hypothetical protein